MLVLNSGLILRWMILSGSEMASGFLSANSSFGMDCHTYGFLSFSLSSR